ncbi:type 1 glutamine amidotransferase [Jatrophihabitans sp. GAS493]|uniref:type 1 glutamine amidotransferase n=1 Tax=Jatrophihabitans sp. GAS493 TaxID=1907575 RepID=UPI0018D58690|nr:type 1 glutamine amidotransferase [Jatrophihabitans sp. GAS493]
MSPSPVLVVQNDPADPLGPLGDWLTAAGLTLDLRRPYLDDELDQLPATLGGHSGLLVLGGEMGANDDQVAPWLPQLRALLKAAVDDEVPTLGICLGGQLLASATGGEVGPSPEGPEFGAQLIAKRASSATDPLFKALPITPDVIQWHFDAVLELPPGAIQLASSPGCDIQAFRVGRVAWGTQFHIETTPEVVRAWATADAEALTGYDVERILARADAVHPDLAEVWAPFAAAFAGVVLDPSSVPKVRTVATQMADAITDPAEIRAALAMQMQAARPSGPVPIELLPPDAR